MNKTVKTVALLSILGLTATSCQKENLVESYNPTATETVATYTVCYTIDGVTTQITIVGETAWNDFLEWLFALAEEGHSVNFFQTNRVCSQSKETVTYSTPDKKKAIAWATEMSNAGYQVTIVFDENSQVYVCTAIK